MKSNYKKSAKAPSKYPKKKPATVKSLEKKVNHIANDLIELKWTDDYLANAITTTTGRNFHMTDIAQGDQPYERNGNQITPTSLQCRYSVYTPVGQRTPAYLRCIVFWDRQANAADNQLLTVSGGEMALLHNAVVSDGYLAPFNYRAKERFTVLYDKTHKIEQSTVNRFDVATGAVNQTNNSGIHNNFYIKLGRQVKYKDQTATFPITNALHVVFVSSVSGNDEAPLVTFGARMYYKDA